MKDRTKYLGGTDAAPAVGLSKWKPAYELYLEKTGQLAPALPEDPERLEWGQELEEAIGRVYARRTGRKIRRRGHEDGVVHKKHPFLVAHPDYVVVGERRGLDSKNVGGIYFANSDEWGEPGSDNVPTEYFLQAQAYMNVLEYDAWDIAALVGGNRLAIFTVMRDEAVIRDLEAGMVEFWGMVQAKTPPPLDYDHPKTLDILQRQHREVGTTILQASADLVPWCAVLEQAKEKVGEYAKVVDGAKARILEAMGGAGVLMLPEGSSYVRKVVSKKAYTVEAQSYVELRRKASK